MTLALIAVVAAMLADIVSTLRGLGRDGVEANPVIRWFMEHFAPAGWIAFKTAMTALGAWLCWNSGAEWGLWLIAAVTGAVAVRNMWVT